MKYKIGDRVRIANVEQCRTNMFWSDSMKKWCGTIMTIRGIDGCDYKMEEDIGDYIFNKTTGWNWNEGMFESIINEIKKQDLKDGMLVKTRHGDLFLVCSSANDGMYITKSSSCIALGAYGDDLKNVVSHDEDIMAVYDRCNYCEYFDGLLTTENRQLLWKRKKVEEMTLEEVCKELGREIKIIKG